MYRLMVAFEPTRVALVAGGGNEGLYFGNVVNDSEVTGNGYHVSEGPRVITLLFRIVVFQQEDQIPILAPV